MLLQSIERNDFEKRTFLRRIYSAEENSLFSTLFHPLFKFGKKIIIHSTCVFSYVYLRRSTFNYAGANPVLNFEKTPATFSGRLRYTFYAYIYHSKKKTYIRDDSYKICVYTIYEIQIIVSSLVRNPNEFELLTKHFGYETLNTMRCIKTKINEKHTNIK